MDLIIVIIERLLAPLVVLVWPIPGIILSTLADGYDYGAITSSFIGQHNYQYVDKLLDAYYLVVIVVVSRRWADATAKKVLLSLFCYRLLGVTAFFITGREYLLFFFPNLIVDFFIFYVFYHYLSGQPNLIRRRSDIAKIIGVVILPKISSEFYLHVYRVLPLPIPQWLRDFYALPNWAQTGIYLVVPVSYLFWRVRTAKTA